MGDFMLKVAQWISENKYIQSLIGGLMAIMPITLGVAAVAVLINLPMDGWQYFLTETTDIRFHAQEMLEATQTITALYISFTIAYTFTKNEGENGVTGGIMALASFLILMPQTIPVLVDGEVVGAAAGLARNLLGSQGIFVAMINALLIAKFYTWLMTKNLKMKLPEGVPPMVAESLSPTFVAMIMFSVIFAVRVLVAMTEFGTVFAMVHETVGGVVMGFGGSPWAAIGVFSLMAFGWFFGIHPSAIMSVYMPVMMTNGIENQEAFLAGLPIPNMHFSAVMGSFSIGGSGATLGLSLIMIALAKSAHMKAIGRVAITPGLFNINEPFLFGIPLMLNPLFIIPMVGAPVVGGLVATVFYHMGFYNNMNPTIAMPWVMPAPITAFFVGGWLQMIAVLVVIVAQAALYLPFFLLADKKALKIEKETTAKA